MFDFRWIDWNIDHIAEHGVTPAEAEEIVNHARRPFPRATDNGKWLVHDRTFVGRYLQVIYLLENENGVFVIHARPLTDADKRRLNRLWKHR